MKKNTMTTPIDEPTKNHLYAQWKSHKKNALNQGMKEDEAIKEADRIFKDLNNGMNSNDIFPDLKNQ